MEFLAGRVRPVAEDFCRRPNPRPLDGLLRDPGAAPVLPLQGWRLGDRLTREGVSGVVCHAQAVLRHHHGVELRPGLTIENSFLDTFAQRSGISRLALYGSVLRDDFGPSSDVDMLVEFLPLELPASCGSPRWNSSSNLPLAGRSSCAPTATSAPTSAMTCPRLHRRAVESA